MSRSVPRDGYTVRAVARAASLLDLLRSQNGGATLDQLATGSGLAKPTVFRLLRTLEQESLVERVAGSDQYRLGLRCLELGQAYLEQADLRKEAAPVLAGLRDRFDETVHLGVLDDDYRVVYLDKLETRRAVGLMMSRLGRTAPAHCTGLGKALLASTPGDPVTHLERRGTLQAFTLSTITEPEALRAELRRIRERGFALDLEEHEPGVRCVATPIHDSNDGVVAALSIAGPAGRLPEKRLRGELAEAVRAAAEEVSRRLGGG